MMVFPKLLENGLFLLWREAVQKSVVALGEPLVTFLSSFSPPSGSGCRSFSGSVLLSAQQLEILLHDRLLVSKFHV